MKKKRKSTKVLYKVFCYSKTFLIMRITAFLLLFSVIQVMGENSYSQSTRLTLNLKDVSIENVLDEIENQSEFYFLFNQKLVNVDRKVDINAKNKRIKDILSELFADEDVNCLVMDRQILLSPEYMTETVNVTRRQLQEMVVTGKVTDEDGNPLPGVNIIIKGTIVGTITNADGNYSIQVDDPDAVLVFSYVGFQSQEIEIAGQTSIDVTLQIDILGLEEVVAIGYGSVRRSDLTGSVVSVKSEELVNIPFTNISQALQGKAAGVNVRQSETSPGGSINLRVRGVSTFMGTLEPLYVIDGLIGGDINAINPTDIESIEILKDASSTAIYGTMGANGVVLISTKSGESGKTTINFDGYYGVQAVIRKLDLLNAREWAEMDNYRSELLGYEQLWDLNNLPADTDFQDLLYEVAPIQNYNLSSTGGSPKLSYFASVGYINQEGIIMNSDYDRYNLRLNINSEISDRVKIGNYVGLYRSSRSSMYGESIGGWGPVFTSALMLPYLEPYDENGNLVPYFLINYADGRQEQLANPLHTQENQIDDSERTGISGSVFAEIELIKGLNLRPSFSYNLKSGKNGGYKSSEMWNQSKGFLNSASLSFTNNFNYNTDILLTYENTFDDNHKISLLGGFVATKSRNENSSLSVDNFAVDIFSYHSMGAGQDIQSIGSNLSEKKGLGYISRINYIYQDKYYFTFSSRYDGSSVMGRDKKWGFFPSGAIMWRLSEEQFIKNMDVFHDAKLRASYGISGSDALGAYASYARMSGSLGRGYNFNREPTIGYRVNSLAVPDLAWEETAQLDIGLEASFLKGKIGFIFDYYHKKTTNLFLSVPVPRTSSVSSITKNTGSLENRGYEFMVKATPFSGTRFNYSTSLNISFQEQEVTDIGNVDEIILGVPKMGPARNVFQVKVGQQLGSFYGLEQDGLWQLDEEYTSQFGTLAIPGDIKYVDQNNDGDITEEDRVIIGNALPKFFGGWRNTLTYKGFDANIFFDFLYGNDIYNVNAYRIQASMTTEYNKVKDFLDYWTPENPDASYPSVTSTTSDGAGYLPEWFLEDGSFLRLKELSLGYTLPSTKIKKMHMYIFLKVTNVFTLTNYKGGNPEVNVSGSSTLFNIEHGGYAYYRTFTIGSNINF